MPTADNGYGVKTYLQMVTVTAAISAAVVAFGAAGPLGLFIGLPFAAIGLTIGVPLAALVGAPVWFGIWGFGLWMRWRSDTIAVLAAFLIGLVWVAATKYIDMHLPHNRPRGPDDPIVLPGILESMMSMLAATSYIPLLVGMFVSMRFYGARPTGANAGWDDE